jgi:hypothetical protein
MSTIFRKTAKGVTEIETRQHRLTPRVRNALILVDGKRDVSALKVLMPQLLEEALQALLDQGFVEIIGESAAPSPSRAAPVARSESRPMPMDGGPSTVAPSLPASGPSFTVRQRTAVRDLNDTVGPMAESLAIRMERARDEADLRALVQMAVQLIGNARGRSAAEGYATRHRF